MDSSYIAIGLQVITFLVVIFIKYKQKNALVWKEYDRLDICAALYIFANTAFQFYDVIGLLSSLGLLVLARASTRTTSKKAAFTLLILTLLSLAIAIHLIPGFRQFLVFEEAISNNNLLFSLYLRLDKATVGMILFIYLIPNAISLPNKQWLMIATLSPLLIVAAALMMNLELDIKYGDYLLWFLPINLFVTCLTEEIFFRRIIQEKIINWLPQSSMGTTLSIVIVGYIFSLAHGIITPDSPAAILYIIASLLYAWVYQKTRSVGLSIMTHFSMNISHITLLPYPLF